MKFRGKQNCVCMLYKHTLAQFERWVSLISAELQPVTDQSFISEMLSESMSIGEMMSTGENRRTRKNSSLCNFAHRKAHMNCLGREFEPLSGNATNDTSYGSALAVPLQANISSGLSYLSKHAVPSEWK
jgi:hypothetical protein